MIALHHLVPSSSILIWYNKANSVGALNSQICDSSLNYFIRQLTNSANNLQLKILMVTNYLSETNDEYKMLMLA